MLKHAFSLVELMVSLVIVSCITAAMTPVITKKLSSNAISLRSSEVTTECSDFGEDCDLCYEEKCIVCAKTCTEEHSRISTPYTIISFYLIFNYKSV